MTKLTTTAHVKALFENLELSLLGGTMASVVDTFWCIMDVLHNGLHWHYMIIIAVLTMSSIILLVALIRHHRSLVKQHLGLVYKFKKDVLRVKLRHNRRTHE